MTLTEFAVQKKVVSWMVTLLLLAGGLLAFMGLGRLEDPEFSIKQAVVTTAYPGASALEVEEEVTLPIEDAIQQLPYVDNVESISAAGLSQVTVEMKTFYRKDDLAQIWDEMRRKIGDMRTQLPPGVSDPAVHDDFGDVYGTYLAVTGPDFTYEELADYVDTLRRELVLVDGVGKVVVGGQRTEQVVLEVSRAKMTALDMSISALQALLNAQNLITDAGRIEVGSEYVRISSTGAYQRVEDLNNLLLGQVNGKVIHLSDVATVTRAYADPPTHLFRFNGHPALTVGVSFASGVNVVDVGRAIQTRLAELDADRPIGIDIGVIYDQPSQVDTAVAEFLTSLVEAVAVVMVVLFVAMGWRSGLLMSLVLLLTILGTFIVMDFAGIALHRISLGALIISLGMLVDNAIVITEGILIGLQQGLTRLAAAKRIVSQMRWPLLGATIIAATAFAPIGLSPDQSGEFAGTLFWVLLISLMISWIVAISLTPFFASVLFRDPSASSMKDGVSADPYRGVFYGLYRVVLTRALRFRWTTTALILASLGAAIYGFGFVTQAFFPPSRIPIFLVDYWLDEGADIRTTERDMAALETAILKHPAVKTLTASIGQGHLRYMLPYAGERSYASYGQFLVEIHDGADLDATRQWVAELIHETKPEAFVKTQRTIIGHSMAAKVEARISGPDTSVLRDLAARVMAIYHNDPDATGIRHDWRNRTKVLRPQFAEAEARRLGISRTDLDNALAMNVSGVQVGLLREGSTMLPVLLRAPLSERADVQKLNDVQIFSPTLNRYIDIQQVVREIGLQWEDPLIMRRDRKRTIAVWADPDPLGPTNSIALFERLRPQVEALELPAGYTLEWGGEYERRDEANQAIFEYVPLGLVVMVGVTVLLFNSLRQTVVVWLTVPLSVVGVTFGLLVLNTPFSFMALLGLLSLSGMVLKNGIVLIEEIKRLNEDEDKTIHDAIAQAAVSRLRPVTMAALTTVLGLLPLLLDEFFAPLAVTIIFGLSFATVLTLIVVPVLFALVYRVKFL